MRVIKKSEVREIIIGHVELTLIFLFDDFLCKIAILEPLKVRFLDKKQKLLSDDGTFFMTPVEGALLELCLDKLQMSLSCLHEEH